MRKISSGRLQVDLRPNSYGFRPKRSPHQALAEVGRSVLPRMTMIIDMGNNRMEHPLNKGVRFAPPKTYRFLFNKQKRLPSF
ncbi:hypothetical protein B9T62_06610 [Paenibacillus donghaensis]|uniref:Uncharacterized protein n=1 Tax=Paenibacillus donghaensis TaxID=414771 RepID=A0A2Z2KKS6_9BACL|nr:hypothetical protein B9T62_06610 [Paenibacillus donghaensis]